MTPLIEEMIHYYIAAHTAIGQVRKKTGEPYWVHPRRVACLLHLYSTLTVSEQMFAGALCHDVIEDTHITEQNIQDHFNDTRLTQIIVGLSDKYTKENFPELNRKQRKAAEAARLGELDNEIKTIKICDLIDNTESIVRMDKDFAVVYMREKQRLIHELTGACPMLLGVAQNLCDDYFNEKELRILL